ncbi:ABC transporter permease [Roseomonas sp. E05]|uniref:ABC transporter permease n=1 Tax=Roseomonas sp. E05 TaxID=3046310 RepID=UPI0024BAB147|nr:ABC transporter permease [Roseomonas sp. E05]MDJ0391576.1 ABC transporter permease [Roseomonas sp. E05]
MVRLVVTRLTGAVAVLLTVSLLVFASGEALPGDVAQLMLGEGASQEAVAQLRQQLQLDRPAPERYLGWLGGMVSGDWGVSYTTRRPISEILPPRLANTALLTVLTVLVAVPVALGLGILMALFAGGRFERSTSVVLLGLSAMPEFMLATLAVLIFAVKLRWLPAISNLSITDGPLEAARALTLPVLTLSLAIAAQIARMTRATLVNLADRPFIEMAHLKGASRLRVILVHSLANAIGPLANVVTLNIAFLISGVVVVETIFAVPGLAQLMINSVSTRDMPVIEACAMIFCCVYVLLLAAADLLGTAFNPRLRRSR